MLSLTRIQSRMLLGDTSGLLKGLASRPIAAPHADLEAYLGRYSGLLLYLREMDEPVYSKLCAVRNFFLLSPVSLVLNCYV